MGKDKSPCLEDSSLGSGGGSGGLPPTPPASPYAAFASASTSCSLPANAEASSSSAPPADDRDDWQFRNDINRMSDFPSRSTGHRRAHSETLGLPDDISFDSDLLIVGAGERAGEGPSLSDEIEEYLIDKHLDLENTASSSALSALGLPGSECLSAAPASAPAPPTQSENVVAASSEMPRARHQHSQSFDGSTSIKPEMLGFGTEGMSSAEEKKAMSGAKLDELAVVDPKRAKRIWANRQSAARSKERKMRYIAELEQKILSLRTQGTNLSTHLSKLKRDNTGLLAENNELKLRVQTMEQKVRWQDTFNDNLRNEIQRMKIATEQAIGGSGQVTNYGQSSFGVGRVGQQYYHQNPAMQPHLAAHQLQQLQIHSQRQLQHSQQQQCLPLQRQSSTEMKGKRLASQTQNESTSERSELPHE